MKEISKAILAAQMEMGNATKGSSNPFFKSKYADLNAIREACIPALHKHGISCLQPTVHIEGKNFIKTILLHESGETFEGLTEIIYSKINDAQAQGSGITYARRYGLQSLLNIGADDDDGNKASMPVKAKPIVDNESDIHLFTEWSSVVSQAKTLNELMVIYNGKKETIDAEPTIKAMFTKKRVELEKNAK
ncbi:MAG: ERF family protein [Bacteroidia bacterium]